MIAWPHCTAEAAHMAPKDNHVSLTPNEKKIVKALLNKNWRNQDIQALINTGRKATINSGRITGVKKDANQKAASDDEVAFFELKKRSFDPHTGLNQYDDERLVRAREAMILAVQIFNSASLKFKTEVFSVLANIAWTYLLHEYYYRKKVKIVDADGRSLLLSKMIERKDSPLSEGVRQNLRAMKTLRDQVEHLILGPADKKWLTFFQACCLNFDKTLCELFGEKLSLSNDLSLALQFAKMNIEQLAIVNSHNLSPEIQAIDAQIMDGMTEEQINNTEFQFRVIYTLDAASKSHAHFQFVNPDSAAGKQIHNVLTKKVIADDLYPHKPAAVAKLVADKTGIKFTSNDHTKAWNFLKIRPKKGSPQPENTNKTFCIYHAAHNDYTYSSAWIDKLVEEIADDEKLRAIRAFNK